MKKVAFVRTLAAFLVASALSLAQQQEGQLDTSKSIFCVLAAINAAGFDAQIESASNHPLRKMIREEVARRKPASVAALRDFMRQHRQEDANWEMRQYISYALLVDGPPKFQFRLRDHELPPDVAAMRSLSPLLEKFTVEAGLEELWQKSQPAFDQVIARYHEGASRAVLEVNSYLRAPTSGYMGRRFQIYLDLLGAPNQIHFASFLDDYFIVLTHSAEPQINDIRTAYLHFLLDPWATKFAGKFEEKKALGDYAQGAPFLADHYKQDFLLLATKSLIKAVESRILFGSQQKRDAYVDQAMKEGFILTAHFAEQLPLYEKQEQAMRFYFPELITAIDLKREERRLEKMDFATERAVRKARPAPKPAEPELSAAEKTMAEAEELYTNRKLDAAREAWLRAAQQTSEKPLQAKAYYGLARVAALNRDPELAEKLFSRVIELGPEPPILAWSHVYLGRLSQAAGEPEQASAHYRAALAVEGASSASRQAAEKGLTDSTAKKE